MYEAILGDKVDDTVLLRNLHRDGEVVRGLGREEHVDALLLEEWVALRTINPDDMRLREVSMA